MPRPDDRLLLDLWERGADRAPIDRALLLFAVAAPEIDPARLADLAIAERDRRVFGLRRALFGNRLSGTAECPSCLAPLEFHLDGAALQPPPPQEDRCFVSANGLRFRLPSSRDMALAIRDSDDVDGSLSLRRLLIHCCVDATADTQWTEALLAEAEQGLDALAGEAGLQLGFRCECCSNQWSTPFDVCGWLWTEIDRRARSVLDDIHHLARAYGWHESAILDLSPARRNAYLERCGA